MLKLFPTVFLLSLSFVIFQANMQASEKLNEPYCFIKDLPFDDHGWFVNAKQLNKFLVKKPKTIIEIGSWLGCSTRYLAENQPEDGVVYAVDTWLGSPNEPGHQQDPRLPYLYQLFLSNIKHAGLTHKIIPVRMASVEAALALDVMADLIYIDGAHDTDSVIDDITYWYPHLNPGGVLCGDDWRWPTVQSAVVQKAKDLKKRVRCADNFWWYE